MKVSETRDPASEIIQQYQLNAKTTPEPEKQIAGNIVPEEKVSLSTKAKDIQQVKETIDRLPNVREEKVEDLRNRIEQGIYNVSGDKIAEKMVGESLLDVIA
jgi:negative regulator of flagellin synthesis FlgM